MKNPAFSIWLDGQIAYAMFHGLAIGLLIVASVFSGGATLILIPIVLLAFLIEFAFALPAIALLALWIKLLQTSRIGSYFSLVLGLSGYILFMYGCARILWYFNDSGWEVHGEDGDLFNVFTFLALACAATGFIMNGKKLTAFTSPENEEDSQEEITNPQIDTQQS